MYDLSGRTALIAGASSGLGAGFAWTLARAGAKVVLGARRGDRVAALANELQASGHEAIGVVLDVTDESSVVAAFDAAEARYGLVESVVANAGVGGGGRSTDRPLDQVRRVLDTNLLGAFTVAREGARRMIAGGGCEQEDGRIVLIGSNTAEVTNTGDSVYAASKSGLAHLGRQLAREWVRQGINVNTIQPGWIPTSINQGWFATERGAAEVKALHRRRLIDAEALDDMLLYLLSDRSKAVTGATFTIDDGQSL